MNALDKKPLNSALSHSVSLCLMNDFQLCEKSKVANVSVIITLVLDAYPIQVLQISHDVNCSDNCTKF